MLPKKPAKKADSSTPTSRSKTGKRGRPTSNSLSAPLNTSPTQRLDIYVFGSGEYGELGLGAEKRNGKKPKDVRRPRLNDLLDAQSVGVVQIAVGGMHCVALTHDNQIITWSVNDNGALGRDTTWEAPERDISDEDSEEDNDDSGLNPKESTPTAISAASFDTGAVFVQVAATDGASFALTEEGTVYSWGTFRGADGIIGFSRATALTGIQVQSTPTLIPQLKNIIKLAAGGNHVQALDASGNVFSWGSGGQGQLGRLVMENYRLNALTPSQFGLPKRRIKHISCGSYHSFAINDRDKVYAWGLSNFGQTGIPEGAGEGNAVIQKPTLVKALAEFKISEIQGGNHHSVACSEDGELLVWGRCDDAQAGISLDDLDQDDLIFNDRAKPGVLIRPTIIKDINAVSVAAGIDNTFAITQNGEAYSWGFSANYRTGLGTEGPVAEATIIENTAVKGKRLTFAACGGQFSVLAGPADLGNGKRKAK